MQMDAVIKKYVEHWIEVNVETERMPMTSITRTEKNSKIMLTKTQQEQLCQRIVGKTIIFSKSHKI